MCFGSWFQRIQLVMVGRDFRTWPFMPCQEKNQTGRQESGRGSPAVAYDLQPDFMFQLAESSKFLLPVHGTHLVFQTLCILSEWFKPWRMETPGDQGSRNANVLYITGQNSNLYLFSEGLLKSSNDLTEEFAWWWRYKQNYSERFSIVNFRFENCLHSCWTTRHSLMPKTWLINHETLIESRSYGVTGFKMFTNKI